MKVWEQSLLATNDDAINRETEAPALRASLAPTGEWFPQMNDFHRCVARQSFAAIRFDA